MIKSITTQILRVSALSIKLFIVMAGSSDAVTNRFTPKPVRVWDNTSKDEQSITFAHTAFLQFDYNGFNPSEYDKSKRFIIPAFQAIKLVRLLRKIFRALEKNEIFIYNSDRSLSIYQDAVKDNTFTEYGFSGGLAIAARPIVYRGKDEIEYEAIQLILSHNNDAIILTTDEVMYLIHILEFTDFVTLSNTIITNSLLMYSNVGRKNIDYSYASRNELRSANDIYRMNEVAIEENNQAQVPAKLRNDNLLNQLL